MMPNTTACCCAPAQPQQVPQQYLGHHHQPPQAPAQPQYPGACHQQVANKNCCNPPPAPVQPPPAVCHDVSILLAQINSLSLPSVTYSMASHPPTAVCPQEGRGLPIGFSYDSRLVRDELHHQLLVYLAEGVHTPTFLTGPAYSRIESARALLSVEQPDGYRALQCVLYGTLLLSLNSVLLEDTARNSCLDGRRHWTVSAPCASNAGAAAGVELRVNGTTTVAVDVHPTAVVSNELMDAVIHIIKNGASYDAARGRVIAKGCDQPLPHFDATTLLTQVWAKFAKASKSKNTSLTWVVLTNLDRSIVFHRRALDIKVSHIINGNGYSTPRDSIQNLYSLLLSLATLEKRQYAQPPLVVC